MAPASCGVCEAQAAKYKCPTCLLPFCCVACSKKHREIPCVAPAPVTEVRAEREERKEEDVDEEHCVTEEQLAGMDSCPAVQRKLRDERVMEIVRRIDASGDRAKALEKEMADPAFLEFCNDVLESLGLREPEPEPANPLDVLLDKEGPLF